MKRHILSLLTASVALGGGALAAQAGGYASPVVEPVPAAPPVQPVDNGNWEGGYAGVTLGYAFEGKDEVGVFGPGDSYLGEIGEMKTDGVNGGVRAGYRWQRGKWVFGPEVSFEAGDMKGDTDGVIAGGVPMDAESKINNIVALRMKTGYAVRPDVLVFGTAGVARADVDYSLGGVDDDFSTTGYIVGLGVEKQFNDRMSLTAEYEYAEFDKEEMDLGGFTTEATPKYNNVKVGLNFRF